TASSLPQVRLARVSVQDHGLGIPPLDAPKLFNRFVRLPRDIASSVRGTGTGLYLCRLYIEAMGGSIGVESSGVPGEGATFSFTVPISLPESGAQVTGAALSSAGAPFLG
ncbi:MAG TPA: ATP-binding protein, partial [Ktedonobacterales bacterium]|nr:ATP-binding protein [Ktedonobacterales bacterium]